MRHVTLAFALVLTLALAVPAADAFEPEGQIVRILEGPPSLGPYSDPNG